MVFSQLLIVMIGAIAVTIFADKKGFQAPLVLAFVGLLVSFIPGLPRLELEPEIILSVVVPPLLYSTTLDVSFISFMRRLAPILNLGVALVVVTTVVVGGVAALAVPGLALASALVLASVVSPPDAVTAVAIGRQLGLPKRMMTIITGESLINDAAALTLFSVTVAAVAGTHTFINNLVLYFLYSAIVGVIVGIVLGLIVHSIRIRLPNPTLMTVLSFLAPFTAYLVAEELHASGVLAVVLAGLSLGHNASKVSYESRIQERSIWSTIDALLEAFAFAYIGLQFRFVIQDALAGGYRPTMFFGMAGLVLLAVILVRLAWIFINLGIGKVIKRLKYKHKQQSTLTTIPWQEGVVVGWTGMRGVVTLAAAAGVPLVTATGEPFPGRDAIQAVAFVVTIGTLLLQGLTLPWLIRKLNVSDPHEAEQEREQVAYAHRIVRQIGTTTIARFIDTHPSDIDRQAAQAFLARAERTAELRREAEAAGICASEHARRMPALMALGQEILVAQRNALISERDAERLDDEVMREMLEQLDLQEAFLSQRKPPPARAL